jgi:hypothetical protein
MTEVQYLYEVATPEEFDLMKLRTLKAKTICLFKMGKPPLTNPRNLRKSEFASLIKQVKEMLDTYTDEALTKEFNELCLEEILGEKADYTTYPIYDLTNAPDIDAGIEGLEVVDGKCEVKVPRKIEE